MKAQWWHFFVSEINELILGVERQTWKITDEKRAANNCRLEIGSSVGDGYSLAQTVGEENKPGYPDGKSRCHGGDCTWGEDIRSPGWIW